MINYFFQDSYQLVVSQLQIYHLPLALYSSAGLCKQLFASWRMVSLVNRVILQEERHFPQAALACQPWEMAGCADSCGPSLASSNRGCIRAPSAASLHTTHRQQQALPLGRLSHVPPGVSSVAPPPQEEGLSQSQFLYYPFYFILDKQLIFCYF